MGILFFLHRLCNTVAIVTRDRFSQPVSKRGNPVSRSSIICLVSREFLEDPCIIHVPLPATIHEMCVNMDQALLTIYDVVNIIRFLLLHSVKFSYLCKPLRRAPCSPSLMLAEDMI